MLAGRLCLLLVQNRSAEDERFPDPVQRNAQRREHLLAPRDLGKELGPEVRIVQLHRRIAVAGDKGGLGKERPAARVGDGLVLYLPGRLQDGVNVALCERLRRLLRRLLVLDEDLVGALPQQPFDLLGALLLGHRRRFQGLRGGGVLAQDGRVQAQLQRGDAHEALLVGLAGQQPVDANLSGLADPVRPRLRLEIVLRIPVGIVDHHVAGVLQVEPHATRPGADEEDLDLVVVLKSLDVHRPLGSVNPTIQADEVVPSQGEVLG
mmetsp:Transcript_7590/g.28607  ORF Transcript_7590/g.28607 Transcript_7590/m.28607 type:complete len:264 (+) Transcript_7590:1655-2446(+)